MEALLEFIRRHKFEAWLAGNREAFLDWEDAELDCLTAMIEDEFDAEVIA